MAASKRALIEKSLQAESKRIEHAPLLLAVLRVLQSLVKNATIELSNGVRVFVDHESGERSIRFHCDKASSPCDEPCQDLLDCKFGRENAVALCRNLEPLGCSVEMTGETEQLRQDGIERVEGILDALQLEEKASLLSIFGEDEFKAFLDTNAELENLQPLQYWFTNRINQLKTATRKTPKRPVKAQRKVGDYLYTLQPSQKGGDYWYLHFSRDGKRHHIYLGKQTPTFEPDTDLAQKHLPQARAAGV